MEEQLREDLMPLIALRGLVVFPNMVIHFDVGREKSVIALERAMLQNQRVFLVAQKDASIDLPLVKDLYSVGTVAKIKQMVKLPTGNIRVLVEAEYRAKVGEIIQSSPYFLCQLAEAKIPSSNVGNPEIVALVRMASQTFKAYTKRNPKNNVENIGDIASVNEPGRLADIIVTNMNLKTEENQKVLATLNPKKRLELVIKYLTREMEISDIESQITGKVKENIDKNQKEFYLREQMRVIQQELDGGKSAEGEAQELKDKLYALKLSDKITEKIEKEIDHLSKMIPSSQEAAVIRSYVEWVLELPWRAKNEVPINLAKAKTVLDKDHYGLDKVKERILEYLAVLSLTGSTKGAILCLVGPPGVGKTSIARSVARATGREFVHVSLGGVKDEAEIRGHRKTYVGAIPGRVMSAIKECGSSNPVFLFDEVDKIGSDFQGDPASALLEVLDPEQNAEFTDHYLEIPFDLSDVLFITTANTVDTIPAPLLDRMEVIEVSGYTEEEKFNIAKKYLLPKQIKKNGLSSAQIGISAPAMRKLITAYTRESGVRNLEKQIANLCRKVARKIVEGETEKHNITPSNLESYLGKERCHYDKLLGENPVGVATGLAWTTVGGDTLFIESAVMKGSGHLNLTGQLGDVMQESAKAALSYIRSKADNFGIQGEFYKEKDIHIHVPEGATPKDGPSAGVTMCVSLVSALTGRAVLRNVAMTGEITLRGQILPVGGIKEKVLAAHRMGISKILLPAENKKDLEELPQSVRSAIQFVFINNAEDALKEALE